LLVLRLSCSLLPLDDSPTASRCNLCHSEHLDVLWCCLTSFLTTLPHAQATKPPKLAASSRDQNAWSHFSVLCPALMWLSGAVNEPRHLGQTYAGLLGSTGMVRGVGGGKEKRGRAKGTTKLAVPCPVECCSELEGRWVLGLEDSVLGLQRGSIMSSRV
jgi:hypothetical protein